MTAAPNPSPDALTRLVPMREAPAPGRCPAACFLGQLRPSGRRTQLGALARVSRLLCGTPVPPFEVPWHLVRYEHVVAVRAVLSSGGYAPAYVNAHLTALRGVLREAWRLGWMPGDAYLRAKDVPNVTGSRLPAGRMLTPAELQAVTRAADPREACAIALLYGGGLRRVEAAAVTREDLREDPDGTLWVRVEGKRGKEREVPLAGEPAGYVRAWAPRAPAAGPILGWTPGTIYEALQGLGRRAGVAPFTPHDLRRSFVSVALELGVDLRTVAQMAGHSDVRTTARYDRRGEEPLKRAARRIGGV